MSRLRHVLPHSFFIAGLLVASDVHAADPPRLVGGCGPGSAGRSGASGAIAGDPQMRKGWLDDVEVDDAGNKYEVWCIEIAGGVGNSFGQRYVPKGGAPVWLGRCAFVGGRNKDSKESTGDANKNGVPDNWKKIKWTSRDPATGKDYDWEYDVAGNGLKRWETKDGKRVRPNNPDYDDKPVSDFGSLLAVADTPPGNDALRQSTVAVALLEHAGFTWSYGLAGWTLDGFSPTIVNAGDSFSLAARGILSASAPQDWIVAFDDAYVSWTYEGDAPMQLTALDGFSFQSSATDSGEVGWVADSEDDEAANFGYAGIVLAPVPEAPAWLMFGAGLLGLAVSGQGRAEAQRRLRKPASAARPASIVTQVPGSGTAVMCRSST